MQVPKATGQLLRQKLLYRDRTQEKRRVRSEYKRSDHWIFYCRRSIDCALRILLLTNGLDSAGYHTAGYRADLYNRHKYPSAAGGGVTAYDSHDGDVTASLLIEKVTETGNGKVIVTYAAVDSSITWAEQSRILKVEK